jgi:hypothetical protein
VNFNCNLPTNDFEKLIEMIFEKWFKDLSVLSVSGFFLPQWH